MIDLHCHILHGVDDGPTDLEESLEMARQAVRGGIHTVVATPHSGNGVYVNERGDICRRAAALNRALEAAGVPLTVAAGAEEHFRPGLGSGTAPAEVTFLNGSGRYLLVEFPFMSLPDGAGQTLLRMLQNGLVPVLAHPERNGVIQQNIDLLYPMIEAGCLIQITAQSLTGELGAPAMACAYRLVKRRLAHIIASDAHSAGIRRPALSAAVAVAAQLLGNPAEAARMVRETPRAILSGERVCRGMPEKSPKKRWWWG